MKQVKDVTELTEKGKNNVQVVLKIPESFMKRFDDVSDQLGYTRTEAIKEAMRRFQELNEQKVMQRPENISEQMKQMMSSIFTPIIELAKLEDSQKKVQPPLNVTPQKQNEQ